jgi:hypothetical protein
MKVERQFERSTENEVRRRNGRRKPARTRADRILVLTGAVRGNSYGFVASGAFSRARRDLPCGMRESTWRTQHSCGRVDARSCAEVGGGLRSAHVGDSSTGEQREARRWESHHGRRQPDGCEIAETTFVALLAEMIGEGKRRSILVQHGTAQRLPRGFVASRRY